MMEIKENTKKEYNAPQMNVMEIRTQFDLLLVCSGDVSGEACIDDDH